VWYSPNTVHHLRKLIDASGPWKELAGPTVKFFKSEQAHNAAPHDEIGRGRSIICQLERGDDALKLVPLENRLIVLGNEHLVFLEVDCSRNVYNGGRKDIIARQRQEHDILFDGHVYKWAERIDGARFEEFARDLLSRRRGIVHVRRTSVTNEGDAGADLLCIWDVPALADVMQAEGTTPIERRTIVVQCKAWARAVGKGDVADIRDTLERHDATGILVIAPSVRHSLSEHLAILRRRNIWADYWGRGELEEQLDSSPDLVRKYADLVTYAVPEA
jgi:Restriction endonuclease